MKATEIASGLWQSARPAPGHALRQAGFEALVLSAAEYQPSARSFPGVLVLHVPLWDGPLEPSDALQACGAAEWVVSRIADGRKTLVSCYQGRNRSGLISAIACAYVTGRSGSDCALYVQSKVPGALTNTDFVKFLKTIKTSAPVDLR